jgi:hypothetical protein
MSSISTKSFSSIDDDHKELSLSKEIDFKIEAKTLDTWISLSIHKQMTWNFSHIHNPLWSIRSQSCRSKKAQTKEIWPKN